MTIKFLGCVQAGFPSPAGDYLESDIDLKKELIKRPTATYYFRVTGDSMNRAFIPPNSLLIVDRVETKKNNSIVLAIVDGDFTVKRLSINGTRRELLPESFNPKHRPIVIEEYTNCEIWGVVTHIIINTKNV